MEKNTVIITILTVLVLGLGGYIYVDRNTIEDKGLQFDTEKSVTTLPAPAPVQDVPSTPEPQTLESGSESAGTNQISEPVVNGSNNTEVVFRADGAYYSKNGQEVKFSSALDEEFYPRDASGNRVSLRAAGEFVPASERFSAIDVVGVSANQEFIAYIERESTESGIVLMFDTRSNTSTPVKMLLSNGEIEDLFVGFAQHQVNNLAWSGNALVGAYSEMSIGNPDGPQIQVRSISSEDPSILSAM